jgi:hypothetical protein
VKPDPDPDPDPNQSKLCILFFLLGGASKKHSTKNIKRTDARELIDWDKKIE